jgi:hypothetical protein
MNQAYIEQQKASFLSKVRPPDFHAGVNETEWVGVATADDITDPVGRRAMGLQSLSVS